MTIYNKLVRDRIPDIIRADGKTPITRTLGDDEFLGKTLGKTVEEAIEFRDDPSITELADLQEMVNTARDALGITAEQLEAERLRRAEERGGFKKRIFLERVEDE